MNWLFIIAGGLILICMIKGYKRGSMKALLSLAIMMAAFILSSTLSPYVEKTLSSVTPIDEFVKKQYEKTFDCEEANIENCRIDQIRMIEGSDLPDFLKDNLIANNNYEMYHKLKVHSFKEYVTGYISWIAMKIVSFLILSVILYLIFYSVLFSFDFIDLIKEPNLLHRGIGTAMGFVSGVICIWIFFSILTVIYGTPLGMAGFQYIEKSRILIGLYRGNMLLKHLIII